MQLFGRKKWNLYGRTSLPPIREDRDVDEPWTPEAPTRQLILKTGDFLYVPRGFFHDAETSDEPSIHLTLGFFAPNWIDIVKSALTSLYENETLRKTPTLINGGNEFAAEARSVKELLMERLDLFQGLTQLRDEYFDRHVDVRTDRLLDGLFAKTFSTETMLRVQTGVPYQIRQSKDGKRVELKFAAKKLSYPIIVEPVLKAMIESDGFSVSSLQTKMSERSLQLLCEQLLREGLLTFVR